MKNLKNCEMKGIHCRKGVDALVEILESLHSWITAKRLACWLNERTLRAMANASEGRIITGQKGYKAAWWATPSEIAHSANWLEHQAKAILERADIIRSAHLAKRLPRTQKIRRVMR
jgi:hypothetical protein